MSEQEEKIVLSRSDLYLVMESYRNNIALNTTLIEQQKQILLLQNDIIDKQQDLADKLKDITINGTKLLEKQEEVLNKTVESSKAFVSCAGEISTKEGKILEAQAHLDNAINSFKNDVLVSMKSDRMACSQDHSSLKNTIKLIIGTFGVITLSALGLAATIFSRLRDLDDIDKTLSTINKILPEILKKLGG